MKNPHKIIDRLYLGGDDETPEAEKRGYTILSMAKAGPNSHMSLEGYTTRAAPKNKNYYFVDKGKEGAANLVDSDDPNYIPDEVINDALDYAWEHYSNGETLYIHCNQGHSRGPTTTLMFLRTIGEMPYNFQKSERIFRTLYPNYKPGLGMEQYAKSHWGQLENKFTGDSNEKQEEVDAP